MAGKGMALLALGALGVGLLAAFAGTAKAKAKATPKIGPIPPVEPIGPTEEEISASQEFQYLAGLVEAAMQSQNPATLRSTANKLRNYAWQNSEVAAEAATAADALDEAAKDIEGARRGGFGSTRRSNRGGDEINWEKLLGPLRA